MAPDREQSAHQPLADPASTRSGPQRRSDGAWQVDGTPTDCVMLALQALMPERPDFVFSGINHGPNMGEDVLYSGTVSAAMEAVMLGVPGVGAVVRGGTARHDGHLSRRDCPAGAARHHARGVSGEHAAQREPAAGAVGEVKGLKVTSLGSRYFSESLSRMKDPWGREIFWIGGGSITWTGGITSDHAAIHEGYISVTPLQMDLTNYGLLETVRGWSLEG